MPRTAPPLSSTPRKTLNSVSPQRVAEVADLEAEPHVGAVRAEPRDRLVVGHARETAARSCTPPAAKAAVMTPSVTLHHVLLRHERHLQVELRELELAIRAQRLVAEAARDLVVALVAGDHQQLLEQLRRLRQRVEAAALHAARHHEVARALGRRARQDRRLDVEEAGGVEVVAHRARDVVAQLERALHRLAAQVEVAVAQAQRLVDLRLLVDREGRRLGAREHLVVRRADLDLAGRPSRG